MGLADNIITMKLHLTRLLIMFVLDKTELFTDTGTDCQEEGTVGLGNNVYL